MSCHILCKQHIDECVEALIYSSDNSEAETRSHCCELIRVHHKMGYAPLTNEDEERIPYELQKQRTLLGQLLWKMNLRAVQTRYPKLADHKLPGPLDFRPKHIDQYRFEETETAMPSTLFTIDTLLYNSDEAMHLDNYGEFRSAIRKRQNETAMQLWRRRKEMEQAREQYKEAVIALNRFWLEDTECNI